MINAFDGHNHYWVVSGSANEVYSSATNTYVGTDDTDFTAWTDAGNTTTQIANEAELWDVLKQRAPGYLPEWLFNGETFVQPAPGDYTNAQLVAYSADTRWRKEQGGITLGGLPIATDDRSKQMIMGARIAADADPNFTTQWVGGGNVYPLTSEQIIDISNAVLAHVASCFATFATVSSGIDDGTITTTEEIDAAFAS